MMLALSIFAGGGAGALLRHFLAQYMTLFYKGPFPLSILVVNLAGCLAIGFLSEAAALKFFLPPEIKAFLFVGILGGFTTFSAFSLDVLRLMNTGEVLMASLYVLASVAGCIIAAFTGFFVARGIWG